MTWDKFYPEGRTVYYEGSDPQKFMTEMLEIGIIIEDWEDWREFGVFFLPPGRVEEVYGSERWGSVLGS